jgi:hypothetical protein
LVPQGGSVLPTIYVRFWHKADMPFVLTNVRFRGNSGH